MKRDPVETKRLLKEYAHRPLSKLIPILGVKKTQVFRLYRQFKVKRPRGPRYGRGAYVEIYPDAIRAAIDAAPMTDVKLGEIFGGHFWTVKHILATNKIPTPSKRRWMKDRGFRFCHGCKIWQAALDFKNRRCRQCRSGLYLVKKYLKENEDFSCQKAEP